MAVHAHTRAVHACTHICVRQQPAQCQHSARAARVRPVGACSDMKGIYEGSFDYLHTGRVWRVIVCRLCVTQLQDISIGVTGMFTGMSTC